jgi:hypothetical protein
VSGTVAAGAHPGAGASASTAEEQRVKRADVRQFEPREASLAFEQVVLRKAAGGGVDADRHVEIGGPLVERKEVGIGQAPVAFEAADEHRAGAMRAGAVQLVQRHLHDQERQHRGPVQTPLPLRPDVGHPAVIAPTERVLDLGPAGQRAKEHARVEDLDVHAQLVHVAQAELNVQQLARGFGRILADVRLLRAAAAVDQPPVDVGTRGPGRLDHLGTELALGLRHVAPGALGLEHVRVGVDRRHGPFRYSYRRRM